MFEKCYRAFPPSQRTNGNYTHMGSATVNRSLKFLETGADVIVIGTRHLEMLWISKSRHQPTPPTATLTADGSQIPVLGYFNATLMLGNKSCIASI